MTGRLNPIEQAAVDSIDPARIERELRAILAIPSVTGDEEAVQAAMAGLMAESGLSVERVATDPRALGDGTRTGRAARWSGRPCRSSSGGPACRAGAG